MRRCHWVMMLIMMVVCLCVEAYGAGGELESSTEESRQATTSQATTDQATTRKKSVAEEAIEIETQTSQSRSDKEEDTTKVTTERREETEKSNGEVTEKTESKDTIEAITEKREETKESDAEATEKTESKDTIEAITEKKEETKELGSYLSEHEGSVSLTLRQNGKQIFPDQDGNYPFASGAGYEFRLMIRAPKGIQPGVYSYQLPKGVWIDADDGREKDIYVGETEKVGRRSVDQHGQMTIFFDEIMNEKTNVVGYIYCKVEFEQDETWEEPITAKVEKEGCFDAGDGKFHCVIDATIPAFDHQQSRSWYLYDLSRIIGPQRESWIQKWMDGNFSIVDKATKELVLPLDEAVEKNKEISYFIGNNEDGKSCIYFVNRCHCTKNNCDKLWDESLGNQCYIESLGKTGSQGWCDCWTQKRNITLQIAYAYENSESLLTKHAGDIYINAAYLVEVGSQDAASDDVEIPIPKLLSKSISEEPSEENGHKVTYKIYVNEDKVDLSKRESLTILDDMKGADYIEGSMNIVETGMDDLGQILTYGEDYSIDYSGVEGEEKHHVMTIILLHPKACSYEILYKARIIGGEEGTEETVRVSNTATIVAYGNPSKSITTRYTFDEGWSYEAFSLRLLKVDLMDSAKHLAGATYGFYDAQGKEMTQITTDEEGEAMLKTQLDQNIRLESGVAYYLKELSAPEGYQLDLKKYWFYFSEEKVPLLDTAYAEIVWMKTEGSKSVGEMTLADEEEILLPETGGRGIRRYVCFGSLLLLLSIVFYFGNRGSDFDDNKVLEKRRSLSLYLHQRR